MKYRLTALVCALLVLLSSCTRRADPALSAAAPDGSRRLTVYTSHKEEVYAPIVKEFEERTGIWVEVVTGGTGELLERIEAEAAAPRCDVMFGGGVESLLSYAELFEPYTTSQAEQIKPELRQAGDVITPFSALPVVLIYNPRLVEPGEVTGWADLLRDRWRGKIALADPAVSGSSYTAVITLLTALPGDDWELLARLRENLDDGVLPDSGDVVTSVSLGSRALGVTLEETALKRLRQGANIAIIYPVEGTSVLPDGTALIGGAPHRDNAVAFLEFVQGADVQALVVSDFFRRSVRSDADDPAALVPAGELTAVEYDVAWASAHKEEVLERWAQLGREAAQ